MTRPEERSAEFLRGFASALGAALRANTKCSRVRRSVKRAMHFSGITLDDLRNAGCAPVDAADIEAGVAALDALQRRLNELRTAHGLWDEQVVNRAKNGTLPPGPDFVEWLSLLRRDNLIKGASRRWKSA